MNKTLLVTRPDYELTTHYLYFWSENIISSAREQKLDFIDLKKTAANKKEFIYNLLKLNPALVIINGHGNKDLVTGQNSEILIRKDVNEEVLKGKIVYAISCQSGKLLGPACIKKGTKTYLGYDEDFIFLCDENSSNPLNDKTAALYLAPAYQLAISLVNGKSAKEAYNASQNKFSQNIKSIVTSGSKDDNKNLLPYLLWDKTHQKLLGDEKAKI